jgi:hypothetical protein
MIDKETERDFLFQIIEDQLRRHSAVGIVDLYKVVYQATYGVDHYIKDKVLARKDLQVEWENTERIPAGETLLEMIDPLGELFRVNIRIYKKIGGESNRLFNLFIRTAEEFKKDANRMNRYWHSIMDWAEEDQIPFSKVDLQDFWIEVGQQGFPPVHHSEGYVNANRPSYRVILKRLWEEQQEISYQSGYK